MSTLRKGGAFQSFLLLIAILGLIGYGLYYIIVKSSVKNEVVMLSEDLELIEFALILYADDLNLKRWWLEGDFNQGPNPLVTNLHQTTSIEQYLDVPLSPNYMYVYDNDGEQFICGSSEIDEGVNIIVPNVTVEMASQFDGRFDEQDGLECGKIRHGNGNLIWGISPYQEALSLFVQ